MEKEITQDQKDLSQLLDRKEMVYKTEWIAKHLQISKKAQWARIARQVRTRMQASRGRLGNLRRQKGGVTRYIGWLENRHAIGNSDQMGLGWIGVIGSESLLRSCRRIGICMGRTGMVADTRTDNLDRADHPNFTSVKHWPNMGH